MNAFQPVILWTDALVFLLILVFVLSLSLTRNNPLPWRRIGQSRSGMFAAVILLFYGAIGVLDSVHFRPVLGGGYSVEVLSLFDALAKPLRDRTEKTYSSPFSAHSFAKESVILEDGTQARDYPRLKYGGAHLRHPEKELLPDVGRKAFLGMGLGLTAWFGVVFMLARRKNLRLKDIFSGNTDIAWGGALGALLFVFLTFFPLAILSGQYHVFGTDKVGQDVFYLALKSIRTALVIGTLTTLVMLPFSIWLGITAGFFGGFVDDLIQYVYTTLNSIPGVLLIAASVLMLQVYIDMHPFETMAQRADLRLLFLCIILGVTSWTGLCRLLRGETLKLREMEYIQAAQAFGVSNVGIIRRHLLPNVLHIVLISVVMEFSSLVLAEAVLSYVGVGVDPSMISFGTMINSARLEMAREPMVWWSLAAAFGFMFVLVLCANLFADSVRDAFDPRLAQGKSS